MAKIFLINYFENYAFCFGEDKEKAEEIFMSINCLREFCYENGMKEQARIFKKEEKIKKELKIIELKEGKHYLTKYKDNNGIEITLKCADNLPIIICKEFPRNPLEGNMTEENKRKIITVIEKIIKNHKNT